MTSLVDYPARRDEETSTLTVVGIGASAGGLDALMRMLPSLSDEYNITYVIIQHMDPDRKSLLVDILSPLSAMKVLEIQQGMKVERQRIYITPPNSHLSLEEGTFQLSKPLENHSPKPSVDLFFSSLANQYRDKAIGVILSGTGSDGALGVRAIKSEGGYVIVQQENSAKFNGMPRSAQQTGAYDLDCFLSKWV